MDGAACMGRCGQLNSARNAIFLMFDVKFLICQHPFAINCGS